MSKSKTSKRSEDPDARTGANPPGKDNPPTRILVVEDSATQAQQLRFSLEADGFEVAVAEDGPKGLELFNASVFDLVISDIVMPGLSGYELCRQIKAHPERGEVPVILLTSLTDPMDIVQGVECGADNFITKPYQDDHLLGRIRMLLENVARRTEGRVRIEAEVVFMGKTLTINSDKEQILSLLISTFEEVVCTNRELRTKEAELRDANQRLHQANGEFTALHAELEQRVQARTAELARTNESLQAEILERKRTEATLREQRELFQVTLSCIGDGVITCDAEGSVTLVNPVAEALTGWTQQEALGKPLTRVFAIINEETRQRVENPVRQVLEEGVIVGLAKNTILIAKGGAERPIDDCGAPIRDAQGHVLGVILVFRDVAERRRAEQTRSRLAAIVESSDDAVVGTTMDGIITDWNPGAERMGGYAAAQVVGKSISLFMPSDRPDEFAEIKKRLERGEPTPSYETVRVAKDGKRVDLSVNISPIRNKHGKVVGASTIARDISHTKRLEEQLRQALKMEAIGRLAGGVAHDFNNVLTIISGYSELLLKDMKPENPNRALIQEIYKAGERAALLTRQLLAFSRRQVLEPKVLLLNSVVQESAKMLQRLIGEDIQLTTTLAADLNPVKVDPGQIDQVILNLAVNARDAMPQGGQLTIETCNVELDEEYAHMHLGVTPGRYVMLAVSDTGHGMDDAVKARIFEPFFTTKPPGKGTGLGLATVYGIVKQSGGNVFVYSELGGGTTFKIYLPMVKQKLTSGKSQQGLLTALPGTETILLVEDEPAVRSMARSALQMYGYTVLEAGRGDEAIRVFEQHRDTIHLLVTDVVMPGMSGRQLVEALRPRNPALKVLYVSGYTDDAVVRHGVLEADTAFLQKPFTPVGLANKIREVLDDRKK